MLPGSVAALGADGQGQLIFFWRHLAASGTFDLERDRFYAVDLRRGSKAPRMLALPPSNQLRGSSRTALCAGPEGLVGWIQTPGGFVSSPALGCAPGAPPVHGPEEWPPQI